MVEKGSDLHRRGFIAGLLLVGVGSLSWALYMILIGNYDYPPALFSLALGAEVLIVTVLYVFPEYMGGPDRALTPDEEEARTERLSLDELKEYLDTLGQVEDKWLHHMNTVASSTQRQETQPEETRHEETRYKETRHEEWSSLPVVSDISPLSPPEETPPPVTPPPITPPPVTRPRVAPPPVSPPPVTRLPDTAPPVVQPIVTPSPVRPPPAEQPPLPPLQAEPEPVAPSPNTPPPVEQPPITPLPVRPPPIGLTPTTPLSVTSIPISQQSGETSEGVVEDEVKAFNTATSTGIPRQSNEGALSYVNRARAAYQAHATAITDAALVESVMDDLVEALRTLSEEDMDELGQRVGGRVNKLGRIVGIPRGVGESIMDYVSRLQTTLRARSKQPPKAVVEPVPTPPAPAVEPAAKPANEDEASSTLDAILHPLASAGSLPSGLPWVLSLYRGFLKSYFSASDLDTISDEMISSSSKLPAVPGSEEELLVYSRLLKNAIQTSQRTGKARVDIDKVLNDFDQFVETLSMLQQK